MSARRLTAVLATADEQSPERDASVARTALFRFDPKTRALHLVGATGFGAEVVRSAARALVFRLGDERGLIGLVGARRLPHYVVDTLSEPRWVAHDPTIRSAYLAPVLEPDGELLGVFALFATHVDAFSAEHRALADLRATDIAAQLRVADRIEAEASSDAAPPSVLAAELRRIGTGHESGPPLSRHRATSNRLAGLSERELEVVSALRRGMRLSAASRALGISVHTARNHLKRVYQKLGVHSQVELLSVVDSHARPASRPRPAARRLRALYVEDNPLDADLMRRELARDADDMELIVAASIAAARDQLAACDWDVLLIDLGLPDGDGFELVTEVRNRLAPLPIIVLTGSDAPQLPIEALKAGAHDYWVKRDDYLPRAGCRIRAALRRFAQEANQATRPLRVLYVDDNPADIDLTRREVLAHDRAISIEAVGSNAEALARLTAAAQQLAEYDLALLAQRAGTADALDLLKVLRDERGVDLPAVVLVEPRDSSVVAQALRFGASDCVVMTPGYRQVLPPKLRSAFHRAQVAREQRALRDQELRLRRAEARFRLLFEKVGVGVAQLDVHSARFLDANPRHCELLGYRLQELVTLDLGSVTHAHDRPALRNGLAALAGGAQPELAAEVRWLRKDGRIVRVSLTLSPLWNHGEDPDHCMLLVEELPRLLGQRGGRAHR